MIIGCLVVFQVVLVLFYLQVFLCWRFLDFYMFILGVYMFMYGFNYCLNIDNFKIFVIVQSFCLKFKFNIYQDFLQFFRYSVKVIQDFYF